MISDMMSQKLKKAVKYSVYQYKSKFIIIKYAPASVWTLKFGVRTIHRTGKTAEVDTGPVFNF